jgi:hypothetical protein
VVFRRTAVGVPLEGGIIAYILQPGDPGYIEGETHGLIAAANDQSTGTEWGCFRQEINGADGEDIGTGYQNTMAIVNQCYTVGTAAYICANLSLNGYDDWFLPSKYELQKIMQNKAAIGGFDNYTYWSSTEANWERAVSVNRYTSFDNSEKHRDYFHVRAIRVF